MIKFIIEWGVYLLNRFIKKPKQKRSCDIPKDSFGSCMIVVQGFAHSCGGEFTESEVKEMRSQFHDLNT